MKRFWKDNRGMTLVELLITLTILGIVATPLLHGFLTSARTEVKAREMGEVTAVAQSVLEAVEGNGFEKVVVEEIDDNYDIFEIATNNNVSAEYYSLGSYYRRDGANKPATEDYHIGLKNYKYDGKEYEVMVDIASSEYSQLNDVEQMSINTVDQVLNVIPESEVKTYTEIYPELYQQIIWNMHWWPANREWYENRYYWLLEPTPMLPDKTVTVNVETFHYGFQEYVKITVGCKLEYSFPDDYQLLQPGDPGYPGNQYILEPYTEEYVVEERIFEVENGEEPTVYLLYHPSYTRVEGTYLKAKDTIVIKNGQNVPFDLYIVKQQNAGLSEGEHQALDTQYQCNVEHYMTNYIGNPNEVTPEIYTNLMGNPGVTYQVFKEWAGISSPVGGTLYPFRTETEARDRIYEVTVKVFEKSSDFSGEPLGTLTGAILK